MTKTDLAILTGDIDAAAATIKNVSVITVGEARGHGMEIDTQTLLQVKAAAETYAGGLKVKTDHYSGFNEIVGALKNFTIDGDQLRADLFLLKNHEATARIIEMAELMPDTFGLSISFSGEHEEKGETVLARCSEIYSADLVDTPAANPTGLFSAKVDSEKKVMDEKQIADAIAAALAPVIEDMAALSAKLSALEAEDEKKDMTEDKKDMTEDEKKMGEHDKDEKEMNEHYPDKEMNAKLSAELAEIKALVRNFGAKPVSPAVAAEVKTDSAPTNFSEAVKATGLTGTAAIKAAIKSHPALYTEARQTGITL